MLWAAPSSHKLWLLLTAPQCQVVSLLCSLLESCSNGEEDPWSRHGCSHNPPAGREWSWVGWFWFWTVGSVKESCRWLRAVKVQSPLSLQCLSHFLFYIPFRITFQNKTRNVSLSLLRQVCAFCLILCRSPLLLIKCCCCSYTATHLQNHQCSSVFSASALTCCIGYSLMSIFFLASVKFRLGSILVPAQFYFKTYPSSVCEDKEKRVKEGQLWMRSNTYTFISVLLVHIYLFSLSMDIKSTQKMPRMPHPIEVLLTGHSEQPTATAVLPIYPEAENCTWPVTMADVTDRHGATSLSWWELSLRSPGLFVCTRIMLIILL